MKPNRFAYCVAVVLTVFMMASCGGGGGEEAKVPDVPVKKGDKVEEPQIPIRNQAGAFNIRKLPPIPEERKKSIGGLNAILQLMLHNPAWVETVTGPFMQKRFLLLPEYQAIRDLAVASLGALGFERPHERLMAIDLISLTEDKEAMLMLAALRFAPVKPEDFPAELARGERFFMLGEEGVESFDELPAQERIIGIAFADGKDPTAYLKKGEHWFGVNDGGFSKVDMNYLRKLGKDVEGSITAVSYGEG